MCGICTLTETHKKVLLLFLQLCYTSTYEHMQANKRAAFRRCWHLYAWTHGYKSTCMLYCKGKVAIQTTHTHARIHKSVWLFCHIVKRKPCYMSLCASTIWLLVWRLSCLGESEVGRVSGCAHFIHHHCGSQPRTFSLQIAMLGNFNHKELIRFLAEWDYKEDTAQDS